MGVLNEKRCKNNIYVLMCINITILYNQNHHFYLKHITYYLLPSVSSFY